MSGRVVFITGASSGIGSALAREAVSRGSRVVILGRRRDRLEALAKELDGGTATRVLVEVADVCEDGQLDEAAKRAVEAFGRIDVVVANAGFGVSGLLEKLTLADYRRQMETNVFGVLRTVYATLPALRESRGVLGLVGSVSGYVATPRTSPYSMSKFAVRALAESLSFELEAHGIAVTHIAPGFIESEIRSVDNAGVQKDGRKDPIPAWIVMPKEEAARQVLDALDAREREIVVTLHGKVATQLARHAPDFVHKALVAASAMVEQMTPKKG